MKKLAMTGFLIWFVLIGAAFAQAPPPPTPALPTTFNLGGIPIQFTPSDQPVADTISYLTYNHHKIVAAGGCSKYFKTVSFGIANADLLAFCGEVGRDIKDNNHAFFGISPLNICGLRVMVLGDERGRLAYGISGSLIVGSLGSFTGQSKPTFCGN